MTKIQNRILVVEDEANARNLFCQRLWRRGFMPVAVGRAEEALSILKTTPVDLVLVDVRLPGMDGIELLEKIKLLDQTLPVIIITAFAEIESAVKAVKLGAFDYLSKPVKTGVLIHTIKEALRTSRTLKQFSDSSFTLPENVSCFGNIIGKCEKMREVFATIKKVAASSTTPVLIRGESGTGKELVARAIHYQSARATQPFVEINCSAMPENLLETELFGYEKGAFTDAKNRKMGLLELSDGGSFFLDEIGDMSQNLQAKLLKAIEEKTFRRVGGTQNVKVSVRILAASNKDLESALKNGNFRRDLYYRLNVVSLHLPPLRERGEDILLLANHFIAEYNREYGKQVRGISPAAQQLMYQYSWPGNVRELKNTIERAILLESPDIILPEHLKLGAGHIVKKPGTDSNRDERAGTVKIPPEGISLEQLERNAIIEALRMSHGNQTKAAQLLHISRDTLRYRIKKYHIEKEVKIR